MENPFEIIVKKLDAIEQMLLEIHQKLDGDKKPPEQDRELLNVNETKDFLRISSGALYKATARRKIPFYKVMGRVYFKRTELIEWMSKKKMKTLNEIDKEVDDTLFKIGQARRK